MNSSINPLEVPPIDRPDWPRHAAGEYPVLACVEFDETGHNALNQAILLAATHGRAPLHVVHVVGDTSTSNRSWVIRRHNTELEGAQRQLHDFTMARLGDHALDVHCHVRMGGVSDTVLQLALDYDIEVIVVGTHGRKGTSKLMYGSVAQKLLEAARCPLLVAVPRDFTGMSQTLIPDPPRAQDATP